MSIDIENEVAVHIIDTWGYDMPINGDPLNTVRATVSDHMMSMDNGDIMEDNIIVVGFLKPPPQAKMRGVVLTHLEKSRDLVVGKQIEDNGYIITYEVNVK